MKKFIVITMTMLMCGMVPLFSQSPIDVIDTIKDADTWLELISLYDMILGSVILVGGYIVKFIPGINLISKTVYQVLALAIVLIAGFVMFDLTSFANGTVIYALITSIYEVFLKPLTSKSDPGR